MDGKICFMSLVYSCNSGVKYNKVTLIVLDGNICFMSVIYSCNSEDVFSEGVYGRSTARAANSCVLVIKISGTGINQVPKLCHTGNKDTKQFTAIV